MIRKYHNHSKQAANKPMASWGRATQQSRDTRKTNKAKRPTLSSSSIWLQNSIFQAQIILIYTKKYITNQVSNTKLTQTKQQQTINQQRDNHCKIRGVLRLHYSVHNFYYNEHVNDSSHYCHYVTKIMSCWPNPILLCKQFNWTGVYIVSLLLCLKCDKGALG